MDEGQEIPYREKLEASENFQHLLAAALCNLILKKIFGIELFRQYWDLRNEQPIHSHASIDTVIDGREDDSSLLYPNITEIDNALDKLDTVEKILHFAKDKGVEITEEELTKEKDGVIDLIKAGW